MERMIALKGLDAALELFCKICEYHGEDTEWADIARAVNDYIIIYRKQQKEQEVSRIANLKGKNTTYIEGDAKIIILPPDDEDDD